MLGPVLSYFGLLAVAYSGPLWWALIELAVATNSNPDLSIFTSPLAWGRQYLVALAIRTLVIGIVAIGISIAMGLATRSAGASVIRSLRGL